MVAYRARQPLELTAAKLEEMADKGLISASHPQEGEVKKYAISQFVVGFYEDQVNRLDRKLRSLWKNTPRIF